MQICFREGLSGNEKSDWSYYQFTGYEKVIDLYCGNKGDVSAHSK